MGILNDFRSELIPTKKPVKNVLHLYIRHFAFSH